MLEPVNGFESFPTRTLPTPSVVVCGGRAPWYSDHHQSAFRFLQTFNLGQYMRLSTIVNVTTEAVFSQSRHSMDGIRPCLPAIRDSKDDQTAFRVGEGNNALSYPP